MNRASDRLAAALATVLAIAFLAACSVDSPSATATPPAAGSSGLIPTAAAASGLPATFGPPPSPTPDDAAPIVIDPTLLEFLPETIDGVSVHEDIDEAAVALSNQALSPIATALGAAVAVEGDNLVLAWVVRLRPDRFTLDTYRQWRDSYDAGACTAAGGVVGHAEAEIGGRTAFVTSCAAGLHTYHVWLEEQDVLISASSLGEARFGEKLLAALRVPE
ncbi:MAG TPA: hypothetical protein VMQ65_08365 [Candidatus Limnocylindria bacterium]|nr:hypothetical protein [Candidatus Limnocylindria bacterium]